MDQRIWRKPYLTIILIVLMLLGALENNMYHPRPNPWTITSFLNTRLQFAQPNSASVKQLSDNQTTYQIPTNSLQFLKIQFFFTCLNTCGLVTVSLPTTGKNPPLDLTVFDPLLPPPGYYTLTADSLTLYELQPVYSDLESFLRHPPDTLTATEPYTARFIPFTPTIPLSQVNPNQLPDYILTTYQPPRLFGRYFEFNRTISLNGLALDNGILYLKVYHTGPGPLYLTTPTMIK